MSNMVHTSRFTSTPVVGEVTTGVSAGRRGSRSKYTTEWSGIYQGVQPSEWDGQPMHMFRDGTLGDVPQSHFGIPVVQFVGV